MNVIQFFDRWPKKEGRLFFFGDGSDHDRLAAHQLVADSWRKKVDRLDFIRLYQPTMKQLYESVRQDPLLSKYRVVVATEMSWPSTEEDVLKDQIIIEQMAQFLDKLPRDIVIIISSPVDKPTTKYQLAQHLIRKGYWVVLTRVDVATATELLHKLTGWEDQDLLNEVVEIVGTSPAELIGFLRVLRMRGGTITPAIVRDYLNGMQSAGVFEIVDAILMKDVEHAMFLYAGNNVPIPQIIGALDRKFSSLLQFTAEIRKGKTPKEAMIHLRLPGFIVHGLFEATKRWTPNELVLSWQTLAEFPGYADKPGAGDMLIARLIG